MVTVELEICFDSSQFAGGARNLQDQWAVEFLPAKKFLDMSNLAREFWKNFRVTPTTAQKFLPFLE